MRGSLGPYEYTPRNDIWICSAISAGLTGVTNKQTDRQTDHVKTCVAIARIYPPTACDAGYQSYSYCNWTAVLHSPHLLERLFINKRFCRPTVRSGLAYSRLLQCGLIDPSRSIVNACQTVKNYCSVIVSARLPHDILFDNHVQCQ